MLKGDAKENITQILKRNEVEIVSADFGVCLLSSPSRSASSFLSAQGPGVGPPTSGNVSLSTASREDF